MYTVYKEIFLSTPTKVLPNSVDLFTFVCYLQKKSKKKQNKKHLSLTNKLNVNITHQLMQSLNNYMFNAGYLSNWKLIK